MKEEDEIKEEKKGGGDILALRLRPRYNLQPTDIIVADVGCKSKLIGCLSRSLQV